MLRSPRVTPYYSDDHVSLFHGDCRELDVWQAGDVLVTDPPYGIDYQSRHDGVLDRSIAGDLDTGLRDWMLTVWSPRPAIVFGSWRIPRPPATRMLLVWDTKGALGMGAIDLPWKPAHQEMYVLGTGFTGHRGTDVLRYAPVQASAFRGRVHPHEKPVDLMRDLVGKCPPGTVIDPFAGSGATLRAAKDLGRRAIGVELDERYCEIAARRLGQEVLSFD